MARRKSNTEKTLTPQNKTIKKKEKKLCLNYRNYNKIDSDEKEERENERKKTSGNSKEQVDILDEDNRLRDSLKRIRSHIGEGQTEEILKGEGNKA